MHEKVCLNCKLAVPIKNGDQYLTPDGSLMQRNGGNGTYRDCVQLTDPNIDEVLITTKANPKCIFKERFRSRTRISAVEPVV